MSISTRTPPPTGSSWAQYEKASAERRKQSRRKAFYIIASTLLLVLIGIGIWELRGVYKAHQHQQYLNSIKDDPSQIRDAVDTGKITREEAGQMWREDFEKRMDQNLDKYFALDAAGRKAYMTDLLNKAVERDQQRQQWMAGNGASTRPWGNRPNGQNQANNNNPASRVAQAESRNPQRRAQMQQFFADYNTQWKQMGNPGPAPRPPFFGGGRGR